MTAREYSVKFNPDVEAFCEKNGIHFYPWIGNHYQEGLNGKRTLIIGESYYKEEWNEYGNFNLEIVKDACPLAIRKYIGEEPTANYQPITKGFITHDKATRIFVGIDGGFVDIEKRKEFWHHVSYYVFVQKSFREHVADNSPFTKEEIEYDMTILDKMLERYKPELVIVYSKQLYHHLMNGNNTQEHQFIRNEAGKTFVTHTWEYKGVKFMGIPHPSVLRSNISLVNLHSLYCDYLQE